MDLTGRRPRFRNGNCYILTYIGNFNKFAEAFHIPNKEAETICRVLVEEITHRFRIPLQLLTDQGREFHNI